MNTDKPARDGTEAEHYAPSEAPKIVVPQKEPAQYPNTSKPKEDQAPAEAHQQIVRPAIPTPCSGHNPLPVVWNWVRKDTSSTDWLIVLLTAVIAGTSYLQWREIRAGSTDTHTLAQAADAQAKKMGNMSDAAEKIRKAAEGMVTQEQRIADNAQKALDVSNKQSKAALDESIALSRLDQRAWVTVKTATLTKAPTIGEPVLVTLEIINSGKTPALNATIGGSVISRSIISEKDFQDATIYKPVSVMVIGPSTVVTIFLDTSDAVRQQEQIDALGKKNTIYASGFLQYDDIFGKQHRTKFRFKLLPEDYARHMTTLAAAERGNDAN